MKLKIFYFAVLLGLTLCQSPLLAEEKKAKDIQANIFTVRYEDPTTLKDSLSPFLLKGESINVADKTLIIFATEARYATISDLAVKFDGAPKQLTCEVSEGSRQPQSKYIVDGSGKRVFIKDTDLKTIKVLSGQEAVIETKSQTPIMLKNQPQDLNSKPINPNVRYALKIIPRVLGEYVEIKLYTITEVDAVTKETSLYFNRIKQPLGEWSMLSEYALPQDLIVKSEKKASANTPSPGQIKNVIEMSPEVAPPSKTNQIWIKCSVEQKE